MTFGSLRAKNQIPIRKVLPKLVLQIGFRQQKESHITSVLARFFELLFLPELNINDRLERYQIVSEIGGSR